MSKKKVISIISLLLVLILSVSAVSYSIATWGSGNENTEDSNLLAANTSVSDYKTTIDMIIEYSNAAGDDHQDFNIVEIVPGATAGSSLKDYVEGGNFKSYVLDANKSKTSQSMNQNALTYNLIQISQDTTLDSIKDVLGNADLIYLSSPSYGAYEGIMNEDIYNWLHNYAMGKNKPLIMDYVTKGDNGNSTNKNYTDLINNISGNYIRYSTYSFGNNPSLADFVNRQNGSYFLPFNTNKKSPTGKILVIGNGNIKGYLNDYVPNGSPSLYYGNNQPGSLSIDTVAPNTVTAADLDGYDFIIIESGAKGQSFSSQDVYTKLKALSESGQFIIYDNSLKTASSSGGKTEFTSTNNYLKLMALIMSSTGISKQNNIMSVKYGFFDSLQSVPGESDSTKAIAAIINSGLYKDGSLDGESGQKFRVLEIEPCYPIDLDLAANVNPDNIDRGHFHDTNIKGSYYTNPSDVRYNTTKDDLSDGEEYYSFEISPAKIAHATGLPESSIQVDQMSVNQLISTKDVILENYDLVYIGGDYSAYTPYEAYNFAATGSNFQNDIMVRWDANFTYFQMYSHTGAYTEYTGTINNNGKYVPYSGNDLTYNKLNELKQYVQAGLPIIIDKTLYDQYTAIARENNRLEQLANKYLDPDSNMYKFLDYATNESNEPSNNINWVNDIAFVKLGPASRKNKDTISVNVLNNDAIETTKTIYEFADSDLYNMTAKGTVTVYKDGENSEINGLISRSAKRPKIVVKSKPTEYDENDDSTVNATDTVSVSVGLSASAPSSSAGYTAMLLFDLNGDNLYDESSTEELKDSETITPGGTVTLSAKLKDEFFGLVNWKVKVVDNAGYICDIKTGSAFFKQDEKLKKTVRILQIMPVDEPDPNAQYWQDRHSLYFCTECQQSSKIIKNNVTLNNTANVWDGNKGVSKGEEGAYSNNDLESADGVTLGKHEHNFGIIMYDTQNDRDDWEDNIADDLTHGGSDYTLEDGEFEFDLDIVTTGQFDALTEAASKRTEVETEAAELVAEQTLLDYESLKNNADLKTAESILETKMYTFAENLDTSNGRRFAKVIKEGIGTPDAPGLWMKDKHYYKLFTYTVANDTVPVPQDLKDAYNNYIVYKNQVVDKKEEYKDYARQSGDADTWLTKNYDIVVLGLADHFGNKDLSTTSCNQLLTYVNSGGYILNSHDTLTANGNAVNLTTTLRSALGMDRFHVTDSKKIDHKADKYFYTERFKKDPVDSSFNEFLIKGPLGLTDLYAGYDTVTQDRSNYRYAGCHHESYDQQGNVNPYGFEAKYGTRRVEKVNNGGVTTYPFAISDTLFVSPTHAQHFALDLEDEKVVPWYTLAGNFVSDELGVNAAFSRYCSSLYAASPKDGMNNYFLYSKENVFYTGAGHQIITGAKKDNNDERRLFINVIVNSVSQGKAAPKLNLYNQCDKSDCNDEDCDHNYVDPKDKVANEKMSKEMNTLFYNGTMYQYNIEDNTDMLYPNFDYKAIAGSAELREIKVFFDLDYETSKTDVYTSDPTNHKLIASYEKPDAAARSGVRDKLNKEVKPTTLKIDRSYLEAYNNKYTYIVVYTKDMNNKVTTARVKINIVPHLFDLTDATTTNSTVNVVADNKLDMTDRYKFNI